MSEPANLKRRAATASVVLAILLIGAKVVATLRTGSVAMLGSLADSALDLLASLITLMAVRIASTPADDNHRFGHGKAEAIAALVQTGIILASALGIGWRAVLRIIDPEPVSAPLMGVGVSLLAIVATLGLVAYQRSVVRRTGSIAINTDMLHYQSDLLLNASVILALGLESGLGLTGADSAFGLLIALYLAWGALSNARHAIDMLMDKEWAPERRAQVVQLAAAHPEVKGVHELRTRSSGTDDFIQFHIWVHPAMTLEEAHRVSDEVEAQVRQGFPQADILIHVDPEGHIEENERGMEPLPNQPIPDQKDLRA
ncbi:cation diffusion facilitator family transporter [Pedomonas mirosovicensis]|uniref:cation diffusion facilitator family transporter n=1 Tax=Pedomonas mirosovicensis TaxID=2908641 RepID=UPI00216AB074|nr:cation diffusion facilitator family transporter [Pedomonas mirosovicensis]MCH8684917.1 cation diffusion facilitator family transporter [Pedomonas mirosovicensis]